MDGKQDGGTPRSGRRSIGGGIDEPKVADEDLDKQQSYAVMPEDEGGHDMIPDGQAVTQPEVSESRAGTDEHGKRQCGSAAAEEATGTEEDRLA